MIQTTTTGDTLTGSPYPYYYCQPTLYCPCCGQPRRQWYTAPAITYTTPTTPEWTYTSNTKVTATPCSDG